ncbi:MAG: GntR family transcriptional regulator [Lachnospiraceae bacterium]|nr:GntR family transcriptional regulator [Lachnospiraceae bacterium]
MIIRLDMASEVPIYVQLRNAIVVGIGKGELQPGEGLPTVRQMAEDLGVNSMTVNKAYAILKNEGFIEIDRRHGARINPRKDRFGVFREKAEEELLLLIAEATVRGVEKSEFMELCEKVYKSMCTPNAEMV